MVSKSIVIVFLLSLFMGCTTQVIEKPVQVKIPVVVPINKPERPVYNKKDTTITYMIKVLEYTKILETLIKEHNEVQNDK